MDQNSNQSELAKSGHLKKPNLSIDLPSQPNSVQNASNATTNQPAVYPPVSQPFGHPHSPFVFPANRFGQSFSPTIIVPTFQNGHHSNLTPKLPLTPFSLNGFSEELRNSPFLSKETITNPFAEVFKQAAINRQSGLEAYEVSDRISHDDKNESLNTPSIDLKSFETRKFTNCSKLDLLITADQFCSDNLTAQNAVESTNGGLLGMPGHSIEPPLGAEKTDNEPQNLKVDLSLKMEASKTETSRMETPLLDTPSTSSTNPPNTSVGSPTKPKPTYKPILPKPEQSQAEVPQSQPNYSYVLKMPDGSSIPLQPNESNSTVAPTSNPVQPTSMNLISNGFFSSYPTYSFSMPPSMPSSVPSSMPPSAPLPINEQPFSSHSSVNVQSPPALNENNKKTKKRSQPNKRKKSDVQVPDEVQTTTLKSIRNVLVETLAPSNLDEQLDQQLNAKLSQQLDQRTAGQHSPLDGLSAVHHLARPDSIHSQSSQCSTSSSMTFTSRGPPLNENSTHSNAQSIVDDALNPASQVTKSKPGRRAKNQPKEDSKEKKARSLERNRNAAQRCRTKRKVWMSALDGKVEELEKQNKDLHATYEKIAGQVQMFKAILKWSDIDNSTMDTYKRTLSENDASNQGSSSHHTYGLLESQQIPITFDSANQPVHSSFGQSIVSSFGQPMGTPLSQPIASSLSQPIASSLSQPIASSLSQPSVIQTGSQSFSPAVSSSFVSEDNRQRMQSEMLSSMGPNYSSFDVLLAAANNST